MRLLRPIDGLWQKQTILLIFNFNLGFCFIYEKLFRCCFWFHLVILISIQLFLVIQVFVKEVGGYNVSVVLGHLSHTMTIFNWSTILVFIQGIYVEHQILLFGVEFSKSVVILEVAWLPAQELGFRHMTLIRLLLHKTRYNGVLVVFGDRNVVQVRHIVSMIQLILVKNDWNLCTFVELLLLVRISDDFQKPFFFILKANQLLEQICIWTVKTPILLHFPLIFLFFEKSVETVAL